MTTRPVLLVVLALACASCSVSRRTTVGHAPDVPTLLSCIGPWIAVTCLDGDPVRFTLDRTCPGGVCGYSCLPNRWRAATEIP
jgi:hypothetical protein